MITKTWLTSQELVEPTLRQYIKALEAMLPLLYNLQLKILAISFAEQKDLTLISCKEVPLFVCLMVAYAYYLSRMDDIIPSAEQLLHPDWVRDELDLEPTFVILLEADFAKPLREVIDLHWSYLVMLDHSQELSTVWLGPLDCGENSLWCLDQDLLFLREFLLYVFKSLIQREEDKLRPLVIKLWDSYFE